jgi:hypothetical protein
MFPETKTVFFQNYRRNRKAWIYIPNDKFLEVDLSTLSPAALPERAGK